MSRCEGRSCPQQVSASIKRGWSTAAAPRNLTRCRCLALKLEHIGLPPFQLYLDRTMLVDIKDGELEVDGEVIYRADRSLTHAALCGPGGDQQAACG